MKKIFSLIFMMALCIFILSPVFASSELDIFIDNLNVQAQADFGAFKVNLSTQFGVPIPRVEAIMARVGTPGDAYMCLRVGQVGSQPVETVVKEYEANKAKGWGVIAKNLGIKPGSKEFHSLKKGNLGGGAADPGKEKGKGKGKKKG